MCLDKALLILYLIQYPHVIPSQLGQGNEDTSFAPEEDQTPSGQPMSYSGFASMARSPLCCTCGRLDTPVRKVSGHYVQSCVGVTRAN